MQRHIIIERNNYYYTICNIQQVEKNVIFGELVKVSKRAKEKLLDTEEWKTIEYVSAGIQVKATSRFLLTSEEVIVIEEKKPDISRSTFSKILTELMKKVNDGAIVSLSIAYHKESTKIREFIESSSQVNTIVVKNIKLENPGLSKKNLLLAKDLINDSGINAIKIENKKEGLNKDGNIIDGLVELAEEGQADLEVKGIQSGQREKFIERTKTIELKRRTGDVHGFIHAALAVLTKHMEKIHKKKI